MADNPKRSAQQLVLQQPGFVGVILWHCIEMCDTPYPMPYYIANRPDPYKHLKQATLVNHLFHEAASSLMYAKVSFERYSQLHPELAPNEATSKRYEFYQGCVKTIHFGDTAEFWRLMPFLVSYGESLHYLECGHNKRTRSGPEVRVDLKKRVIFVETTASLDEQDRVNIDSPNVYLFPKGVERWPRGFKIIRNLYLLSKKSCLYHGTQLVDNCIQCEVMKKIPTKTVPLKSLLDCHQKPTGDDNDRSDQEWIPAAKLHDSLDMKLIARLLEYPLLEELAFKSCDIPIEDLLVIMRTASLKSFSTGMADSLLSPKWSAAKLYVVVAVAAEAVKSINTMSFSCVITQETLAELMEMTLSDEDMNIIVEPKPRAYLEFQNYADPYRDPMTSGDGMRDEDIEHLEAWRQVFPQWEWIWKYRITLYDQKDVNMTLQVQCLDFRDDHYEPNDESFGDGMQGLELEWTTDRIA